jgi:hypothetical protein
VLTTRIRPPATSGQLPFASIGIAKLVVTGCPLKETPLPETVIWTDSLQVSNTVRYPWQVSSSSTVEGTLMLRQGAEKDVTVTVNVVRGTGLRAVALEGYVQVSGQGTQNVSVSVVQVGCCRDRRDIAYLQPNTQGTHWATQLVNVQQWHTVLQSIP